MARVKRGVTKHARHRKIIKLAKGARGRQKNTFRAANQLEAHPEDLTHAAETLTIGLSAAH